MFVIAWLKKSVIVGKLNGFQMMTSFGLDSCSHLNELNDLSHCALGNCGTYRSYLQL